MLTDLLLFDGQFGRRCCDESNAQQQAKTDRHRELHDRSTATVDCTGHKLIG
ncbi:hypothetical protein J6590_022726 [Homalodisca vitripennis]|nr:hypothetical protein J6590_022724 [Homalodisca vitripennis]KAG8327303.1 hypothetical protein J6590_022726 [Homalodisca vitripennis]